MVSYFMKRYAMSEKGAINLKKAILSHTLVNLTKLFAPIIAFVFLLQYIGILTGIESYNFTSVHYIALIVVMMIVMFLVARWDYVRLYTNVYSESANSRIELAERLKKLPLSYFGKRDLADLAETMMNDMNLYETIFSHAVPQIYSTAISTSIIALMLIFYNWKLALAALWVIPISILIIFLSKKSQKKIVQGWIDDNRKVFDNLQENIEQIEQIKSYNLEDRVLNDFFEKLNASTKQNTYRNSYCNFKAWNYKCCRYRRQHAYGRGGKCAGLYRIFNAYSKYLSSYRRNNHLYVNDSYT